jgi:hypothetical protein
MANIIRALGVDDAERGSRVLCIIVFSKSHPITELSGDQFLRAWWQAVLSRCPFFLCSLLYNKCDHRSSCSLENRYLSSGHQTYIVIPCITETNDWCS